MTAYVGERYFHIRKLFEKVCSLIAGNGLRLFVECINLLEKQASVSFIPVKLVQELEKRQG